MLEGLGYPFGNMRETRRLIARFAISNLYRMALRRARAVFVLNRDDPVELLRRRIVRDPGKMVRLNGIGVDLAYYKAPPCSACSPVFLMVGRLLREKGVAVYAAAAERLKTQYPEARFILVGAIDADPACVTQQELERWRNDGAIEYAGLVRDVRPFYVAASVVVLPSWYSGGLPRTLLEGLAAGRALITTDSPGCREAVEHGRNGFLVHPRSTEALVEAMTKFLKNPNLAAEMGGRSREFAERKFDVHAVNQEIMRVMGLL